MHKNRKARILGPHISDPPHRGARTFAPHYTVTTPACPHLRYPAPPHFTKYLTSTLRRWKWATIIHTTTDLSRLPHLAGDYRILDFTSRSPTTSSKSPAFYKQSQFPINSTAKIAPRSTKNSTLSSKNEKNFTSSGEETSAPRGQRRRCLGLAVKARLPLACF